MYLIKLVTFTIFCELFVNAKSHSNVDELRFIFPDYQIEAYTPRGLRVSVPDIKGIQLFAFHGNINKMLADTDAGDMSKDIVKKIGGRWTFEDRNARLKQGDMIYFWLYIIRNADGFRLDNQIYEIQKLLPQPESWTKRPGQKPTRPPYMSRPTQPSVDHKKHPEDCACPIPQPCIISTTTTSTTPQSPVQEAVTPSITDTIVNIWAESLNNATEEKIYYTTKVDYLTMQNDHLINVLQLSDHPNLNKLVVTGRIPQSGDPEDFVKNLLREKLSVREKIVSSERDVNNNIIIEMTSLKSKIDVLYAAKDKLKFSQIVIKDALLI